MIQKINNLSTQWKAYKASLKTTSLSKYYLVDTLEVLVVAISMALIFRYFVLQTSVVPTGSMIPTVQIGDRMFVDRLTYRFRAPHRGEIVVFKSPFKDGKDYVKRCVGLPGETLQLIRGELYINQKLVIFPGVDIQNDYDNFGPIRIPANSYFMMGDNRPNSSDSRYWGFVPKSDILGKGLFTFWPVTRMQVLN